MSEKYPKPKNTTALPAFAGTSAVQHAEPDAIRTSKDRETTKAAAVALGEFGSTNVSSIYWGMAFLTANGTQAWNIFFGSPVQVFGNSQVSVTITEVDRNGTPFLGAATMQVYNVIPQDDGTITVKFNVDWGSPLQILLNFIIVN